MKLLFILLALPLFCFGQNVNIPDANFKAYLVGNPSINTNGDNEIQGSEASAFNGTIDCGQMNISNLTGIEAFVSLSNLICMTNALTSLDISGCTALTTLYCQNNQLTSLNVKNGNNINMDEFENPVDGSYQQAFLAYNNPNLSCIEVDNVAWSQENWWYISEWGNPQIDSTASFSLNCSGAGISDINESYSLMLYPNPTNGDFTITGLELVGTVSSLSLTDMNGKVVKVLDPKATKFSMGFIKPGVYFLNIISGNNEEVLKIVKE